MIYLLDGYNILFTLSHSKKPIATQRESLIYYLQDKFAKLHLSGTLIFDGAHRRDEESGLSYKNPLEIAYTPKGQNADSYIVEKISYSKNPKAIVVVTNDSGLKRHARAYGASVLLCLDFLDFLERKSRKKGEDKDISDSKYNIERLLKIFESRLDEE